MADPTPIRVRRLDVGAAGIAASLVEVGGPKVDPAAIRAFLEDPATRFYAAFIGGRPAGFLYGTLLRRPDRQRPRFELSEIEVLAPFRRRGVATALVQHLKAEVDALKGRIYVKTTVSNAAAMALWATLGAFRRNQDDVVLVLPRGAQEQR